MHITESNFREDHEASIGGFLVARKTLQRCFGDTVREVYPFAEHVPCLG